MKLILYLVCALSYFFVSSAERRVGVLNGMALRAAPRAEQLKYVVGLRIKDKAHGIKKYFIENVITCTGGIIHEKYILTAAHCFTNDDKKNKDGTFSQKFRNPKVTVVANAINLYKESSTVIKVKPTAVYFVPDFLTNGRDDIALLQLASKLDLTGGLLNRLQRPGPTIHADPPGSMSLYVDTVGVLAGYGQDDIGKNDNSLKMAHMRVVDPTICYNKYGAKFDEKRDMCAVAVTEHNQRPNAPLGGCQGDSGAPLVEGNTVIGVFRATDKVSCDGREDAFPQVFSRVSHYNKFISNVIHGSTNWAVVKEFVH